MSDYKDRWDMFKNFMHNELSITKDDVRAWIGEAVEHEAEKMVNQTFGKYSVDDIVNKYVFDGKWGSASVRREILDAVSRRLCERITIKGIE